MSNQSAEQLGFRIGDRFTIHGSLCFDDGSIVELRDNIDSSYPLFNLISGGCAYTNGRDERDIRVPGAFTSTRHVTKIEDSTVTKSIIAVAGIDITEGREYPIYESASGAEYFKDDAGDERLVRLQLRKGARYKDAATRHIPSPDHDRYGFKPGDRVECTKDGAFAGDVPIGTRGTVVEPRDPGVNVRWDNGFSVRQGTATISHEDVRKVQEPGPRATPWADAPEWATHYGIEPSGRHFWFNLPPIKLDKLEFRRGLDSRPGCKNYEITPKLTGHNGKFHVEARPGFVAIPEVTPQAEAKYLIRILKCQNSTIHGSFITRLTLGGRAAFTGSHRTDNRTEAKRFTYEEVADFLRTRAERNKDESFEVILDYIKTGAPKAAPKRGNNGWTVGTKLRCDLSGHPDLHPRKHYVVTSIDRDGDEMLRGETGTVLAKYNRTERNEYTVISEGK